MYPLIAAYDLNPKDIFRLESGFSKGTIGIILAELNNEDGSKYFVVFSYNGIGLTEKIRRGDVEPVTVR